MNDQTDTASFMQSREGARFARLYNAHYRPIRDFCRRRVTSDLVDDAVAETFLVAWRRLDDVPAGNEALLWLYGVAYRVIGHEWRSTTRRRRLEDRLRAVSAGPDSAVDESVMHSLECRLVLVAATRLGGTDAEVLRLLAWEQLSVAEAAAVLAIAPNAVKQRMQRAKRNLAREYRRLESRSISTPDAPTGGAR